MPVPTASSTSPDLTTREELASAVAEYTFKARDQWIFEVREPHLPRNAGLPLVIRLRSWSLSDTRSEGGKTVFDMEHPIDLPVSAADLSLLLLDLVRFTWLHEAAEWLQRDGVPVFDPHDNANLEAVYHRPIPILWKEGE